MLERPDVSVPRRGASVSICSRTASPRHVTIPKGSVVLHRAHDEHFNEYIMDSERTCEWRVDLDLLDISDALLDSFFV